MGACVSASLEFMPQICQFLSKSGIDELLASISCAFK